MEVGAGAAWDAGGAFSVCSGDSMSFCPCEEDGQ
jgi:hypothetical protein